jgi:hypothetical protein
VTEVAVEQIDFPSATQVLALRCVTTEKKTGKTSDETRRFATSLLPVERTLPQLMRLCRGHWGVEGGNHYRRDVTWFEDATSGCNPRRCLNLALIRSTLLGPILRDGSVNLRALCQAGAANPSAVLRKLMHRYFDP